MKIFTEITPLRDSDVFVILNSPNIGFDYPIHSHPEYELNLVLHSSGNRIVGDSVEKYENRDLVLVGPNLYHKWDDDDVSLCQRRSAHVITLQFAKSFFTQTFLDKEAMLPVRRLLKNALGGIAFYGNTLEVVAERMIKLTKGKGLEAVIEFLRILNVLSSSMEKKCLASKAFTADSEYRVEGKIDKVYTYILETFTNHRLRVSDIAFELNMSVSAFGHFFKKRTNKNFTQFIIDLRLGFACKLLLETNYSIGEVSYQSGFNNTANFNRLFRKNKGTTPLKFKKYFNQKNKFTWENQISSNQFLPAGSRLKPKTEKPDFIGVVINNI